MVPSAVAIQRLEEGLLGSFGAGRDGICLSGRVAGRIHDPVRPITPLFREKPLKTGGVHRPFICVRQHTDRPERRMHPEALSVTSAGVVCLLTAGC